MKNLADKESSKKQLDKITYQRNRSEVKCQRGMFRTKKIKEKPHMKFLISQ